MFAQQSQKSTITRPGFHLGAPKKRKVVTNTNVYTRYREILFQKVALGYLLHFVQNGSSKNLLNTHICAQQSQQSENHTARLPFWSTPKSKVMTTVFVYNIYGNILFQKVALGYVLHFVQNGSSKNILKNMFAQQSQTCGIYTAQLPFGSTQKT